MRPIQTPLNQTSHSGPRERELEAAKSSKERRREKREEEEKRLFFFEGTNSFGEVTFWSECFTPSTTSLQMVVFVVPSKYVNTNTP